MYYFTLDEGFDPDTFPNKKALGLFKRFVQNGKEADGSPTRDRYAVHPLLSIKDPTPHRSFITRSREIEGRAQMSGLPL